MMANIYDVPTQDANWNRERSNTRSNDYGLYPGQDANWNRERRNTRSNDYGLYPDQGSSCDAVTHEIQNNDYVNIQVGQRNQRKDEENKKKVKSSERKKIYLASSVLSFIFIALIAGMIIGFFSLSNSFIQNQRELHNEVMKELMELQNITMKQIDQLNTSMNLLQQEQNEKIKQQQQKQEAEINKTNENFIKEQNLLYEKIKQQQQQQQAEINKTNENFIKGFIELDDGWVSPYNGFQYKYVRTYQNWTTARATCHNMGGDLASFGIRNIETRRILKHALKFNNVWIGLNDKISEGTWRYITSYPSDNGDVAAEFSALWNGGQPYSGSYYSCAYMSSSNLLSYSASCSWNFYILCGKPV